MRGRRPQGPEYVDKLQGSLEAKERLKVILDTMSGQLRRLQACAELNIGETRFWQLRDQALQGALAAIEARPGGRPSQNEQADRQQVHELQQRVQELEQELHHAQVREEIALILPHASLAEPGAAAPGDERKKTRRRRVKLRKSRRAAVSR